MTSPCTLLYSHTLMFLPGQTKKKIVVLCTYFIVYHPSFMTVFMYTVLFELMHQGKTCFKGADYEHSGWIENKVT